MMNDSYALLRQFAESAQWDQTLDLSRKLIAIHPDSCDLHQSAGLAALHLGDLREAETHLNKALALSPGDDGIFFLLSDLWLDKGNPEKAEEYINLAISANPEEGDYWAQYSKICYSFGDFATARELAEKAVCFEPGNADYMNLLSISHTKHGKRTKQEALRIIDSFKNALKHDPENPFVHNNIGTIYFTDLKDYDKAADYFRKALVLDPENKMLRNNLFMALGEQDAILKVLCLPRRAITVFGASLAANPNRMGPWLLLPFIAAVSFLWIMFLLPVVKMFESLTYSEVLRRSAEIRSAGKTNIEKFGRVSQVVRILISVLPVCAFWTIAILFFHWEYALAAAFLVSFLLLVFSGLVYLVKETGAEKGRVAREKNLGTLMDKKTEARG